MAGRGEPTLAALIGIPFGLNRLRIGDFVISAQRDKVIVTQRDKSNRHLTIHLGWVSGFVDVHLTRDGACIRTRHRTLFRIRRRLVARALEAAVRAGLSTAPDPMANVRRLRPGWVFHRGWIAMHLAYAGEDNPLDSLAHREKKGRARVGIRATMRASKLATTTRELRAFPEGGFLIMPRSGLADRAPIGVGLKIDRRGEPPRFLWIRISDLMANHKGGDVCVERLLRHGVKQARLHRAGRIGHESPTSTTRR